MTESKSPQRQQWLAEIASIMRARGARAARTVVLLPYAQLLPWMKKGWREVCPGVDAPRFETTQSWTAKVDFRPSASDFSEDFALNLLTARALLEGAGLQAHAALVAPMLMEAARQLAPLAAATPPAERAAWGDRVRAASGGMAFALESAIALTAVAWVANSFYRSDAIFLSRMLDACDCLIVLPGWQSDPLIESLKSVWGDKLHVLDVPAPREGASADLHFHAALNAADEAHLAADCVLNHVRAGRVPVAVTATDRALLRRLRALLAAQGMAIRDETGWNLSTTRAAAHVMTALRAVRWNAGSDAVLDWLKHASACGEALRRDVEAALRRKPRRLWSQFVHQEQAAFDEGRDESGGKLADIEAWRASMRDTHELTQWLDLLRALLVASGQWDILQQDEAGGAVLAALRLDGDAPLQGQDESESPPWARRRFSLVEFTQWVNEVLEAASFKPAFPAEAQVVFLPMAQLLGRDFAAVVLPGCDEKRLPAAPEPEGLWSAAQRKDIGLPLREELQAVQATVWRDALARSAVDVLWRKNDDNGEPLLPSPLVQLAMLESGKFASDQEIAAAAAAAAIRETRLPAPGAAALAQHRVSASAYQDLRHCPYRYFALRLLELREAEEIEGELDKRDFGLWLHAALQVFHDHDPAGFARQERRAALDRAAETAARNLHLAEDEFLPFLSAWPKVRDGYLEWLEKHEREGWRFAESERDVVRNLGEVTLHGRMDRIDRSGEGMLVLDYKTESQQTTSERVRDPLEDVQLAFYAALMMKNEGGLRAAYVNVGERGETRLYELPDIEQARDALIAGVTHDLRRISGGAALPALGEGRVCETCAARGLCRKDWWVGQA